MGAAGMSREEIVATLEEMASLLEIADAGPFEVMAYRNGARNLDEWEGDLGAALADGSIREIPGIGKGLARVIGELHRTGTAEARERLRRQIPPTMTELLYVPGLGPRKIRALYHALGVDSLDGLERMAEEGRIRGLKGFGAKTEESLLRGVARARERLARRSR